jgi:hypothetical protein
METPEAIRTWSLQQQKHGHNTTFVSSSSSPHGSYGYHGATGTAAGGDAFGSHGIGGGGGGGGSYHHYAYSDLRAEMNATTPTRPSWKSMLVRTGGTGVNDDYYHYAYSSSPSSSCWKWCGYGGGGGSGGGGGG